MISNAPDMKNNIFILPAFQYIDFDVFFKVLFGKTNRNKIKHRKNSKLNPMFKITQKAISDAHFYKHLSFFFQKC